MDLFEHIESLPQEVQNLINNWDCIIDTYEECDKFLAALKPLGYEFKYYLDATPYDLRKIDSMKVYRATAYGIDNTMFIIAAKNANEAHQIAINEDMGSVDFDDVHESDSLYTSETLSGILEQF